MEDAYTAAQSEISWKESMLDFNTLMLKHVLPLASEEEIRSFDLFHRINTAFYMPKEAYSSTAGVTLYYTLNRVIPVEPNDMPCVRIHYAFGELCISVFSMNKEFWGWEMRDYIDINGNSYLDKLVQLLKFEAEQCKEAKSWRTGYALV